MRQECWNVEKKDILSLTLAGSGLTCGRLIITRQKERIGMDGCMLWIFQGKRGEQVKRESGGYVRLDSVATKFTFSDTDMPSCYCSDNAIIELNKNNQTFKCLAIY
jgi:hypothetical protein